MGLNNDKFAEYGDIFASWVVDEYDTHDHSTVWYIIAVIVTILLLAFAVFTANYLFAFVVIITALIIIIRHGENPGKVPFAISEEGLVIGRKFHDYDDVKNFSIVFKPRLNVKNLYFEFKNALRPRLSVPLEREDPLQIRKILLKYLPEDTDRTDQPLSEQLAKFFKL